MKTFGSDVFLHLQFAIISEHRYSGVLLYSVLYFIITLLIIHWWLRYNCAAQVKSFCNLRDIPREQQS